MSAKSARSSGWFGEFDWGLAEDLVEHPVEHFAESLAENLVKHYSCSSRPPTEDHRWFSRSEWFADWSLAHLKRDLRVRGFIVVLIKYKLFHRWRTVWMVRSTIFFMHFAILPTVAQTVFRIVLC